MRISACMFVVALSPPNYSTDDHILHSFHPEKNTVPEVVI